MSCTQNKKKYFQLQQNKWLGAIKIVVEQTKVHYATYKNKL